MLRDEIEFDYWDGWLAEVASPKPYKAWQDVFKSQQGLAKRNNVRQFLSNLYGMISGSKNERLVELAPKVQALLLKM